VKWKYLRDILIKKKPGVLCVQEIKSVHLCYAKCYSLCGYNGMSWVHKEVEKESGGVLTMWNNQTFNCLRSLRG